MQYHDHSDYDYASNMSTHAPAALEAMQELNQQAIYGSDNPIPAKYAELMALAVAFTTQCPYCIEKHTSLAKETGVTEEEIAQTTMIAASLRAGAAFGHGLMAMKFFNQEQTQ